MKKFTDYKVEENIDVNSDLISKIEDVIQSEIFLRDVPYSMEEGAQEVDPDSRKDAAVAIVELLKKEGILK